MSSVAASDPLEWIRHVLERIERDVEAARVEIAAIQRALTELRTREVERDRLLEEQRRALETRLRWFHVLFPAGLLGIVAAVWQWLRDWRN